MPKPKISDSKKRLKGGSTSITLDAEKQIRIVRIIFLIIGVLGILNALSFLVSSPATLTGEDGKVYKTLPGATEYIDQSVSEPVYYGIAIFAIIWSSLYLLESDLLNRQKKKTAFWLGMMLSLSMLLGGLLNFTLGAISMILLWRNKSFFSR